MTVTPEELLSRMKNGDEEAFTLIYNGYVVPIRNFARYMGVPSDNTEDISQAVFLTLIKNVQSFDVRRGSATSFLYGIARNHILRWMRENKNKYIAEESDRVGQEVHNPLTEYSRNEELLKLKNAIWNLPEHYREVLILCEIQELSYEQASEIVGCAVGTIRSRLHRARSILAKTLRGSLGESNGVSKYELSTLETNSF